MSPLLTLWSLSFGPALAEEAPEARRRFVLAVGANDGGADRPLLRYAQTDAEAVIDVFTGLGGVRPEDARLLRDPASGEIIDALEELGERLRHTSPGVLTEVVVYYSGHSDTHGLLLHDDHLGYPELRAQLDLLQADVRVAVLDSCASGALVRAKGGRVAAPFLVDEASAVRGHAYLTSAAADEAAQEADYLRGSFFTHNLVTGLRGAGDASGDGRVTLDEAYRFAYQETLAQTTGTLHGTQHASYDIQLQGTGDLVLTDLSAVEARLVLHEDLEGRVYLHERGGGLRSELTKLAGQPLALGLEAGSYELRVERDEHLYSARIELEPGAAPILGPADLVEDRRMATRARGASEYTQVPSVISTLPLGEAGPGGPHISTPLVLSILSAQVGELRGLGLSLGGNLVHDDAHAAMISLGANVVGGDLNGLQLDLGANVVGGDLLRGAQLSAGLNAVGGEVRGLQETLGINTALGSVSGAQLAVGVNLARGAVEGAQLAVGANLTGASVQGLQAAVGLNHADAPLRGMQLAALANHAPAGSRGLQWAVAGLNHSGDDFGGLQLGLVNIAGDLDGTQMGLVNLAQRVSGTQLGLFNIAQRSRSSLGLLSVVREDGLRIEAWGSDVQPLALGLQMGGQRVYSQLQLMGSPASRSLEPALGLGLHLPMGPMWLELDGMLGVPLEVERVAPGSLHAQYRLSLGLPLARRLSPMFGLNLHQLHSLGRAPALQGLALDLPLDPDTRFALWPGVFAGVQF